MPFLKINFNALDSCAHRAPILVIQRIQCLRWTTFFPLDSELPSGLGLGSRVQTVRKAKILKAVEWGKNAASSQVF